MSSIGKPKLGYETLEGRRMLATLIANDGGGQPDVQAEIQQVNTQDFLRKTIDHEMHEDELVKETRYQMHLDELAKQTQQDFVVIVDCWFGHEMSKDVIVDCWL